MLFIKSSYLTEYYDYIAFNPDFIEKDDDFFI